MSVCASSVDPAADETRREDESPEKKVAAAVSPDAGLLLPVSGLPVSLLMLLLLLPMPTADLLLLLPVIAGR